MTGGGVVIDGMVVSVEVSVFHRVLALLARVRGGDGAEPGEKTPDGIGAASAHLGSLIRLGSGGGGAFSSWCPCELVERAPGGIGAAATHSDRFTGAVVVFGVGRNLARRCLVCLRGFGVVGAAVSDWSLSVVVDSGEVGLGVLVFESLGVSAWMVTVESSVGSAVMGREMVEAALVVVVVWSVVMVTVESFVGSAAICTDMIESAVVCVSVTLVGCGCGGDCGCSDGGCCSCI